MKKLFRRRRSCLQKKFFLKKTFLLWKIVFVEVEMHYRKPSLTEKVSYKNYFRNALLLLCRKRIFLLWKTFSVEGKVHYRKPSLIGKVAY